MKSIIHTFAPVLFAAVSVISLHSQILHASGPLPSFEVAIIKSSNPGETQFSMGFTAGGRGFEATNATVRDMIQEAWNVKSTNQIEGAGGWMTGERFDIAARMTDAEAESLQSLPVEDRITQVRLMLQSLLEDRCGVKVHSETRESTYLELVPAKGGPKLKPTQIVPADSTAGSQTQSSNGPRIQRRGPGEVVSTAAPMSMLTDFLARLTELGSTGGFSVGELIVDKTGLNGTYDWTLTWTPQNGSAADANGGTGPSIYTALEEQLELKLKKSKGTVDVLVIDRAVRPSAD